MLSAVFFMLIKKESGTEIGNSLEFDFVVPLNHCVLLDNPKIIERLGLLSQPLSYIKLTDVDAIGASRL